MAVGSKQVWKYSNLRLTVASGVEELDDAASIAGRTASIDFEREFHMHQAVCVLTYRCIVVVLVLEGGRCRRSLVEARKRAERAV